MSDISQYPFGDLPRRLVIAGKLRRIKKQADLKRPVLRDAAERPGRGHLDWQLVGEVLTERSREATYERPAFLPDREERLEAERKVQELLNG